MTAPVERSPSRATVMVLWAWFAVVLLVVVSVIVVNGGNAPRIGEVDLTVVVFWTLAPLYALLGVVIATRRPGNRIGILFLLVSAGLCVEAAADSYLPAVRPDPAGVLDVAATQWSNIGFWLVIVLPIALLLHVFPDGRLLGPRWRWVAWAAVLAAVTLVLAVVFSEQLSSPYPGADWVIDNPIGVTGVKGLEFPPAAIAFGIGMWSLLIGGVVALTKRFRRSTAVVRAQIKWVGYALLLFMLSTIVGLAVLKSAGILLNALTALFIPVSVTLAITRFRLYEIDRIVSRTVTYGVVVAVLAALFGILAALPTLVVGAEQGGETPAWLVALSTLAVAALFTPLRRRVQGIVDRRFDRARFDAQSVVENFADRVRDETDLETVAAGLGRTAGDVFRPESIEVWIGTGAGAT
jgi:hypothetical protein